MTIKDLQPKVVWDNFYGLTRVPRPSKHEEKVIEYLLEWGKNHGIQAEKDAAGNVIMRAPATPGMEKRRGVILQGHMDMVPQKTGDSKHDFLTDPITTLVEGDWLTADRTTLGADNGIGVALALSVLEDKGVKHGPVEVLVTRDEETGMTGANGLKPGVLKGDMLYAYGQRPARRSFRYGYLALPRQRQQGCRPYPPAADGEAWRETGVLYRRFAAQRHPVRGLR